VKRRLLVILGILAIANAAAQNEPSPVAPPPPPKPDFAPIPANWPGMAYAEVRAYLYNPDQNQENLIIEQGKLHPQVLNPDGVKLDTIQIERLLTILRHKSPDEGVSACLFLPHHGIVFYDREGKSVAHVSVCFLCEIGIAEPRNHPMGTKDFAALERLVRDLGLPVFKELTEADAYFLELAKEWPDTKVKAAIDKYLFSEATLSAPDERSLGELLRGLGERTHAFVLSYLADEKLRADWLKKVPGTSWMGTRFKRLCNILGDTPPAAAIPLLAPFLDDADASIRCQAVGTIAKTGAPGIIPYIRRALADPGIDESEMDVLPPPDSGEGSLFSGTTVFGSALAGLQVAMDRNVLHADAKEQLFPDVKVLGRIVDDKDWAKALIGMDSSRAMEFFLGPEILKPDSPRLAGILMALCDANLQIPRERLLQLVENLNAGESKEILNSSLASALLLLGRQHHPDDLDLLRGTGNKISAWHAMPGLLAWHGLEGYRDRLAKQVEEKGFDSLNEFQRLHFAACEFELTGRGEYYFWYEEGGHWRDAQAGLKAMKRDPLAAILEEAIAKFGPNGPSADLETRKAQFEALKEKGTFDDFTERMENAADRERFSLDRFAIEHAESFK
jgi:hypothetical protein